MSISLLVMINDTEGVFGSAKEKLTLLTLAGLSKENEHSFPSVSTIAKRAHISTRSVARALNALEKSGLVKRVMRKSKNSNANISSIYQINIEKVHDVTFAKNKHELINSTSGLAKTTTDSLAKNDDQLTAGNDAEAEITSNLTSTNNINIISGQDSEIDSSVKQAKTAFSKKRKAKLNPKDLDYSSWPTLPDEQVLNDWLEHRKLKRASVTQTVVNLLGKQLHDCVESGISVDMALEASILRGWTGLQAEWVISHYSKGTVAASNNNITSNISNGVIEMNDTAWAEGLEQRLLDKEERTYGS